MGRNDIFNFVEINTGFLRLTKLIITASIMVHFFGCLWHYLALINLYNEQTWIYRNGLVHAPNFKKYTASIYYAVAALTTVGYGDIHAKTASINILYCS